MLTLASQAAKPSQPRSELAAASSPRQDHNSRPSPACDPHRAPPDFAPYTRNRGNAAMLFFYGENAGTGNWRAVDCAPQPIPACVLNAGLAAEEHQKFAARLAAAAQ